VNVRGNGSVSDLGNRIFFLPITIPLDVRDPQKLFTFVRERMEFLKRVRAAEFVGFAGGLFATIPTPVWAAIGPYASQLPLSLCNIIVTNVPGPQTPLYLLGHKMLSWYPYVPIGGEMGVNCAILSYNGMAYFGFTCDVGAVPDPENLEKFVRVSFAELCTTAATAVKNEGKKQKPPTAERPKRQRPDAQIPLAAKPKRARPRTEAPIAPKSKRMRKSRVTSSKEVAPAAATPTTSVAPETSMSEEKSLAVGA
jgi:hypothetical protein